MCAIRRGRQTRAYTPPIRRSKHRVVRHLCHESEGQPHLSFTSDAQTPLCATFTRKWWTNALVRHPWGTTPFKPHLKPVASRDTARPCAGHFDEAVRCGAVLDEFVHGGDGDDGIRQVCVGTTGRDSRRSSPGGAAYPPPRKSEDPFSRLPLKGGVTGGPASHTGLRRDLATVITPPLGGSRETRPRVSRWGVGRAKKLHQSVPRQLAASSPR